MFNYCINHIADTLVSQSNDMKKILDEFSQEENDRLFMKKGKDARLLINKGKDGLDSKYANPNNQKIPSSENTKENSIPINSVKDKEERNFNISS